MLEVRCELKRGAFLLNVDLQLPSPGVSALFGISGAGKSTLVAAIAGLLTPDRGRIVLDGRVLFDASARRNVPAEQRAIGYVFQDGRLFPHYDVHGNLQYGLKRAARRGSSATSGHAQRIPGIDFDRVVELLGLGPLLERRVFELSGGERQRVALGRALLAQPQLLLLDEPLASLDAARKEELLPYFERLRDELALPIVHVTHAFEEVLRIAQHVVVLQNGRVGISAPLREACRSAQLHAITGPEVTGSVLDGIVQERDSSEATARVLCGDVPIRVARLDAEAGTGVRLFVAADDVAIALEKPAAISMRNVLAARIERIDLNDGAALVELRVGDERLLARITSTAVRDLALAPGSSCYALFKAVATHGRRFARAGG